MAMVNAGGTMQFQINGTPYAIRGSFKVQPLAQEATAGRNADGSGFYTTKFVESTIEAELSDAGNLSIKSFQSFRNETIYVALSNGKTYVMTGAVFTGTADLDGMEGKLTVKFSGDVEEVTSL